MRLHPVRLPAGQSGAEVNAVRPTQAGGGRGRGTTLPAAEPAGLHDAATRSRRPQPARALGYLLVAWVWVSLQGWGPSGLAAESAAGPAADARGYAGLLLDFSGPDPVVDDVFERGPAAAVPAIRSGAVVLAVARGGLGGRFVSTKGLSSRDVMKLMAGEPGSKIALKVLPAQSEGEAKEPVVVELELVPWHGLLQNGVASGIGRMVVTSAPPSGVLGGPRPADRAEVPLPASAVQPSYSAWLRVAVGTGRHEVEALLGPPIRSRGGEAGSVRVQDYGCVVPPGPNFPEGLVFSIVFSRGRVLAIEDPFGGVFSTNGLPTRVKLITPLDESVFDHYPRFLDLRWYAASGRYPMTYEVEVDTEQPGGWYRRAFGSQVPFLTTLFSGRNRGRWRVRGRNAEGDGPWSEYRYLRFEQ